MCGRANPLLHDMSYVTRYGRARAADLVPHILGPLGLEDGVAAHSGVLTTVCSHWLTIDSVGSWKTTPTKVSPPPKEAVDLHPDSCDVLYSRRM